ncbi:hypothetical protein SANTM175S_06915 [Streptomyces antimycoticus]
MSVHSHQAAQYPAANAAFAPAQEPVQTPAYPRHVVTAVLVAHDGARWLPDALSGLLGQERPVQSVIAVDTGSADDSARLLTAALGDERVLHMARRSGFGTAVAEAVRAAPVLGPEELTYLKRPSGWDPVNRTWRDDAYDLPELPHGEPVQWLWLLHDDCAPEPDALAELLRVVDAELTANREPAIVGYALVRGSGARLGEGELAAAGGADTRLDGVVANLIAGSGADQTRQLGGYAVRYVYVQKGAPSEMERVLNATPGLTQLSREHGGVLWRVDQRVSRVSIVPAESSGRPAGGAAAKPVHVASGPVEAHTTVPDGTAGRVLRIADRSASDWQATLDGKPLKATTVDGWAQGFELPATGGRLDLTYDTPITHTAWVWAQGLLAVVLLVLALPGRRRNVDDDLPDAEAAASVITAEDLAGDGRRARRLRAAAEAQAVQAEATQGRPDADPAAADAMPPRPDEIPPQPGEPPLQPPAEPAAMGDPYGDQAAANDPYGDQAAANDPYGDQAVANDPYGDQTATGDPYAAVPHQQQAVPHQQQYGQQWDAQTYADAGYGQYPAGQYQEEQYQGEQYQGEGYPGQYPGGQYPAGDYQGGYQDTGYPAGYQEGQYQEGQYPADPYAGGQYTDPYGYDQQQPYPDGGHPPQGDTTYGGADPEDRRDGSEQQR